VFSHHRTGAEEFLTAHVIERGAGVLQHVKFVLFYGESCEMLSGSQLSLLYGLFDVSFAT
jgi:hypothetical protein